MSDHGADLVRPRRAHDIEAAFAELGASVVAHEAVVTDDRRPAPTTTDTPAAGCTDDVETTRLLERAAPGRRAEFLAGRACAAASLTVLGSPTGVGRADDRSPRWPTGTMGSITHTDGWVVAVAAHHSTTHSIGIDAELIGRVTPEIASVVFDESERSSLTDVTAATVGFATKEAFYKAQFPVTGAWVDFTDVTVGIEAPNTVLLVPRPSAAVAAAVRSPVHARWVTRFPPTRASSGTSVVAVALRAELARR